LLHKSLEYRSLDNTNVNELLSCLASGFPFVFGFSVYDSFESDEVAHTGIVPMPGKDEQQLGGHAVMRVGYDLDKKVFIVRNSWGKTWGDHGYFYMPFAYMTNRDLADDFWVVTKMS
jgi:C1A family cysteine protease